MRNSIAAPGTCTAPRSCDDGTSTVVCHNQCALGDTSPCETTSCLDCSYGAKAASFNQNIRDSKDAAATVPKVIAKVVPGIFLTDPPSCGTHVCSLGTYDALGVEEAICLA